MQDPRDPGTLDLVKACKRPLTGAERQKRRREKLKQQRARGELYELQLSAADLDAIRSALCESARRSDGAGNVASAMRLWERLTAVRMGLAPSGQAVSVLFARADSHYKMLAGVEVWDEERDARNWPGGSPVVAHPPCRAWGRLRTFANPAPHEKDLARFAVAMVRQWGGVLEHPAGSTLWGDQGLPLPGERDEFGGWTLAAPQKWWGHKAEKATWFYIVGCKQSEIPPLPIVLGEAAYVVQSRKRDDYRPHISKSEREHTPPDLAAWLVELARRCKPAAEMPRVAAQA